MPGAETFHASADAYDRHVGRYGAQHAAALIAFAGVEPGMRALDVGCGPGALTAALAERLGTASVCGADPSEPFAEACRRRLPRVDVVVATAEALPFADGAFDAVLSQLVVNFLPDAEAGVREDGACHGVGRRRRLMRMGLRRQDDSCARSGMPRARSIPNAPLPPTRAS